MNNKHEQWGKSEAWNTPAVNGGEGSGNFGHEGRPGERGGSGGGGGEKSKPANSSWHHPKNGMGREGDRLTEKQKAAVAGIMARHPEADHYDFVHLGRGVAPGHIWFEATKPNGVIAGLYSMHPDGKISSF